MVRAEAVPGNGKHNGGVADDGDAVFFLGIGSALSSGRFAVVSGHAWHSGMGRSRPCMIDGEPTMLPDNEIKEILQRAQTIAVVGLSDRPERDSNGVARFLQRNGYRIIPVNPNLRGPVLGEQPYASLRDIREHVDIVDVFRRPEFLPQIVEDAIAIGADVLWAQLGVINRPAAQRAQQAGLGVVMDRCMAIEHRRLMRMVESVLY
jgi:predicted CoA-binding protein